MTSNQSIYTTTTKTFKSPKHDGYWVVGENFYIAIKKKPTEQQIKNTKELLSTKGCKSRAMAERNQMAISTNNNN